MITAILCMVLAVCSSGRGMARAESVDLLEFNCCTCYSAPFHQVIFWEWNAEYNRYDARGWLKADEVILVSPNMVICRGWIVRGDIIQTRTEFDPECVNARLLPTNMRRPMPWERGK